MSIFAVPGGARRWWTAPREGRRLLAIPGRLTPSARRVTLHLPARWLWRAEFEDALRRLRATATG